MEQRGLRASTVARRRRSAAVLAAVVSVAVVAGSGSMATAATPVPAATAKDPRLAAEFVEGDVIVGFVPGTPAHVRGRALASIGAAASRQLTPLDGDAALVRLAGGRSTAAALAALDRNPNVRYAEPNYVVHSAFASNDPLYTNGSLWGMYGDATPTVNQFGSQAGEAWEAGDIGSSSVYIGVIDEGIDINHPDLAANTWTNPADPANGVDDDGNGYVDDINGWDFDGNNNSVFDGAGDDHGTHVSGTIGGVGGNGIGVAGVNWDVTLISAKFLGSAGGTTANAILAVDYITGLKNRLGLNIVATSNSWGGGGFSQGLLDAINRGGDAGILFVAAAGNSNANNDAGSYYPANYQCVTTAAGAPRGWDCMITVAAIDSTGAKASFSSYGATMVDIGAPGVGVNSTLPGSSYGAYSGTSMATPHVSGAVALCASMDPTLSAAGLRSAVLDSARSTTSMSGITVTGGRLDVGVMAGLCSAPAQPVTGAPSGLAATTQSAMAIRLDWIDGTSFETYHEVQQSTGACTTWSAAATLGANSTSTIVGGLQPSTAYCFRVRAGNRFDTGSGNSVTGWTNVAGATTDAAPAPYACGAVAYSWVDAADGSTLSMSDDSSSTVVLPFTFTYYGEQFNSVVVGSNGLITFGSGATAYTNGSIPVIGAPDGLISAMWDDLNPGVGGTVSTKTVGSAPNRTFVVSWVNVPHYSVAGSAVTFQAALDEATGAVQFNYLDSVFGNTTYDRGASATIGVESPSGQYGTLVGFNRSTIGDRTSLRCSTAATGDPAIATSTLPNAFVQNPYTSTLEVVGGTAPYTWSVTAGSLPAGVSLSPTSGVLSGTPTVQGTSTPTIRVVDATGRTASAALSLTVELGLYISTTSLPAGGQNVSYSTTLAALNGTAPYSWSSTSLPAGLNLTAASGELWGTPTVTGTFTITFTVTDAASQSATRSMSISLSAAPVISTATLTNGTVNIAVSRTLSASNGTSPFAWSLSAGTLPTGLTLSTGGVVSGTPTAVGTWTFTVLVTDAIGRTDDQILSLAIDPLFVVTTASLPNGGIGYPYSATLAATGGTGVYTWSVTGSLPAGLSVSTAGVISGTPTTLGTSTFTVVARDTASRSSTRSLSIAVVDGPTITTTSLNTMTANSAFSVSLAASGGAGVRTWSISNGSLPAGATLSAGGVLSCTVATPGTYPITVLVTDELGRSDDQALTLSVVAPL
ncbi:MAG: putative Ig domain-containing protein, partial [Ilumatobacteraceae bacterium]